MKSISIITLITTSIFLNTSITLADTNLDNLCQKFPQNSQCRNYKLSSNNDFASINNNIKVINGRDWRNPDTDIPWSVPIMVRDEFDGDYLAVFDINYSGSTILGGQESGVISNWSPQYIRVFAYTIEKQCGWFSCSKNKITRETKSLEVKINDQVFKINGDNGNFAVSNELAMALKNAPPGQAKIRITLEESGASITNDIGEGTVKAWKTVYQEVNHNRDYLSGVNPPVPNPY
jgi:hypothetical protein